MAKAYPNSTFYGTDLVDVFLSSATITPDNCSFQLADTLKGLPFEDGSIDFVFQRFQTLCFRINEWPRVVTELSRLVKPGGWIELGWFLIIVLLSTSPSILNEFIRRRRILYSWGSPPLVETDNDLQQTGPYFTILWKKCESVWEFFSGYESMKAL